MTEVINPAAPQIVSWVGTSSETCAYVTVINAALNACLPSVWHLFAAAVAASFAVAVGSLSPFPPLSLRSPLLSPTACWLLLLLLLPRRHLLRWHWSFIRSSVLCYDSIVSRGSTHINTQCQKKDNTSGIHGTDQLSRRTHCGFGLIDTKLTDFKRSYIYLIVTVKNKST